ncbi:Mu transposase C-terminal domain-containing protein [Roseateles sp.]|uniref:Mu transposase C-terminal domain-containing protein n=1 Tax=Roseateles sp. TaxID=1971397 RepID=UPI0039E8C982
MNGFAFRKHMVFDWSGARYRMERLQPNGEILVERVADGHLSIVTKDQLLKEFAAGAIQAAEPGDAVSDGPMPGNVYARPLVDLTPLQRSQTERKRAYLRGVLEHGKPRFTASYLQPILVDVAGRIGDASPPSTVTFWRWYRRYLRNQDERSLIPRHDLRGRRGSRQSERVLELAQEAITEAYQLSPRTTMTVIETLLRRKVDQANLNPLNPGLICMPSRRTLYRLMASVEAYTSVALKDGQTAADRKFRILRGGVQTTRILERVEIDHTPLDLFLVDDRTGLPCGRPTLTMCLDHFSKMPLGYHLSFSAPSLAAVIGALRHAILPKETMAGGNGRAEGLATAHSWPCYGVPQVVVVDNGLEFHSQALQSQMMDLGPELLFCPKYQPWYKGSIERFLGSISRRFLHVMPGTSLARWHERGDYDPLKHAVLTLGEFTQLFEKWLLDDYAQTVHRSTQQTPWARWHEGLRVVEPTLPRSRQALSQRIGDVTERSLRQDGLVIEGIRYSGPELGAMLRTHGAGVRVRVVFDPEDMGEIQVWAPDAQDPITVRALNWAYANGLTQYQHRLGPVNTNAIRQRSERS